MWWFQRFFLFTPKPWEDFIQFAHIFFIPGLKVETNHQTLMKILLGNSGQETPDISTKQDLGDWYHVPPLTFPDWQTTGGKFPLPEEHLKSPYLDREFEKAAEVGIDSTGLGYGIHGSKVIGKNILKRIWRLCYSWTRKNILMKNRSFGKCLPGTYAFSDPFFWDGWVRRRDPFTQWLSFVTFNVWG